MNTSTGTASSEYRLVKVLLLAIILVVVAAAAAVAILAPESLAKTLELGLQVLAGVFALLGSGYAISRGIAKRPPMEVLLPLVLSLLLLSGCAGMTPEQRSAILRFSVIAGATLGEKAGLYGCNKIEGLEERQLCIDGVKIGLDTVKAVAKTKPK